MASSREMLSYEPEGRCAVAACAEAIRAKHGGGRAERSDNRRLGRGHAATTKCSATMRAFLDERADMAKSEKKGPRVVKDERMDDEEEEEG